MTTTLTNTMTNTTDIDNLYSLIGADPENYKETGTKKDFSFFSIDWHLERFLESHAVDIPPVQRSRFEIAANLDNQAQPAFHDTDSDVRPLANTAVKPAMPAMARFLALDTEPAVFKSQVNQMTKVEITTPASNSGELSTITKPKLSGLFNRLENGSGTGRREQTLLNLKRA